MAFTVDSTQTMVVCSFLELMLCGPPGWKYTVHYGCLKHILTIRRIIQAVQQSGQEHGLWNQADASRNGRSLSTMTLNLMEHSHGMRC